MVKCTVCNGKFGRSDTLAEHMKLHEEYGEFFVCPFCKKDFTRKNNASGHAQSCQQRNHQNFNAGMIEKVWKLRSEASVKTRPGRYMSRDAGPSTSGASTSNAAAAIDPLASPMASNIPEDDLPELDAGVVAQLMVNDPIFLANLAKRVKELLSQQTEAERVSFSERLNAYW